MNSGALWRDVSATLPPSCFAGSAYSTELNPCSGLLLTWHVACLAEGRPAREKRIVYILHSDADPARHYVGPTSDLAERLEWHNHGPRGGLTNENRPWSVVVSLEFRAEQDARRFERYLKSGSGRAFAMRHFAPLDDGRA